MSGPSLIELPDPGRYRSARTRLIAGERVEEDTGTGEWRATGR
jgi:hypothetical protein